MINSKLRFIIDRIVNRFQFLPTKIVKILIVNIFTNYFLFDAVKRSKQDILRRVSLHGAMFHDLIEGDLEPFRIGFGVFLQVLFDGVEAYVFPRGHFVGVDDGGVVALPEKDVVVFVFDEAQSDGCLIYKGEDLVQVAGHAHLLLESPCGGLFHGCAVARVAAAGVGPEAGGVVFRQGALLQQQLAFAVEDEYGEGTVETGHDVCGHLLHDAYLGIVMIDKDYVFH